MPHRPPLEPYDAASAAAMLADAATERITVVPRGSATKLGAVSTDRPVAFMSTRLLTAGLAHYAGDLVATVPAGSTLRDVNAALAREKQSIPLDPPFGDDATIGGIVATNDSGPRRHRYGSPRDLIIGIEVALTNGRVAHAGGRVVKNVAGYDLSRLFCGSRGTLGLITAVTFKLAPVAPASRTVVGAFATAPDAAVAALALAASASLTPSTIELIAPQPRLLVRFESTAGSSKQMAATAARLLADSSSDVTTVTGDDEASIWAEHQRVESDHAGITAVISVLPTAVGSTLNDVERVASELGVPVVVTGRLALGLLRARMQGSAQTLARCGAHVRDVVTARGGHVHFAGDDDVLREIPAASGSPGSAARIAASVKDRFDPTGVLPYPWARS